MSKKFDLFFGFFVIAVFSWFLYTLVSSTFKISGSYNIVSADFSSAEGLSEGTPVKIAGVKVGEVASVIFNNIKFSASVKFKIDSKIKIPVDSSASVQTAGLLGSKYVEISPGSEDENLKNGGEISITHSAINIEGLINAFVSGGKK